MKTMNKKYLLVLFILGIGMTFVTPVLGSSETGKNSGFIQGIVVPIDGEDYYLAGPPIGPNGENDVPGHYWVQTGLNQLVGKHYNEGPFGLPQWWSSDAPDGELLYIVHAIIDIWTPEVAADYAAKGYVHYHEFISANDGSLHPTKVVWLRHTARTFFTFDLGPHPGMAVHSVTPGVDYSFPNNWIIPYNPLV